MAFSPLGGPLCPHKKKKAGGPRPTQEKKRLRNLRKLGNIKKMSNVGGDAGQCPVSLPEIKRRQ